MKQAEGRLACFLHVRVRVGLFILFYEYNYNALHNFVVYFTMVVYDNTNLWICIL